MILGVGTVALDSVETPAGAVHDVPGGSALYFAAAATSPEARGIPVAVVGVTGEDFPQEPLDALARRGVDVSGIVRLPHPTFRWRARYDGAGEREVISVHRGAVVRTAPEVPPALRDPAALFLGSTDPRVQARVLDGAGAPGWVALDTMPHWIREGRDALEGLLRRVDVLLVNQEEVRLLGGHGDEGEAARRVLLLGPEWVIVKRGSEGACAYGAFLQVAVPAAPVARVVDPTGAGDAFAGGVVATLAKGTSCSADAVRNALAVGSALGGRAVSAFSLEGLLDPMS